MVHAVGVAKTLSLLSSPALQEQLETQNLVLRLWGTISHQVMDMLNESSSSNLLSADVCKIPLAIQPVWCNDAGTSSLTHSMVGNGNVFLLEHSVLHGGTLVDTQIVTKDFGWFCHRYAKTA